MRSTQRAAFGGVLALITLAMAAPALAQVPIVVATTPAEDTAAAVVDSRDRLGLNSNQPRQRLGRLPGLICGAVARVTEARASPL